MRVLCLVVQRYFIQLINFASFDVGQVAAANAAGLLGRMGDCGGQVGVGRRCELGLALRITQLTAAVALHTRQLYFLEFFELCWRQVKSTAGAWSAALRILSKPVMTLGGWHAPQRTQTRVQLGLDLAIATLGHDGQAVNVIFYLSLFLEVPLDFIEEGFNFLHELYLDVMISLRALH